MAAEIFPNEGLDMIYGIVPRGATGPANTWLGLFSSWSGTTVAGSAAAIASWSEFAASGAYIRQTISSASWGATPVTTASGRGSAAGQVTFATATAVWGTANGFIICSGATAQAGTVWYGANFSDDTPVAINTNDVIKVTPQWIYTG